MTDTLSFAPPLGHESLQGAGEGTIRIAANTTLAAAARYDQDVAEKNDAGPALASDLPNKTLPKGAAAGNDEPPDLTQPADQDVGAIASPADFAVLPDDALLDLLPEVARGAQDTVLDPIFSQDGLLGGVVSPVLGDGGLVDTIVGPVLGKDGLLGGVTDSLLTPILGKDGLLGSITEPLLGNDGLGSIVSVVQDTVLDPILGQDGLLGNVVAPVLGDDGLVDTIIGPVLGEDGLLGGVTDSLLTPILGDDGLLGSITEPLLGEDGLGGVVGVVQDTVLDPILGQDGLLGGVVSPVLGDGGLVDTIVGPVLGEDGLLGGVTDSLLTPILGKDGLLGSITEPLLGNDGLGSVVAVVQDTVLDPILGHDGLLGCVVSPVLGNGGLVDTIVGPVLGENGLVGDLTGPLLGITAPLAVNEAASDSNLTPVLGQDGLFGNVAGSLLGGLLGGRVQQPTTALVTDNSDVPEPESHVSGEASFIDTIMEPIQTSEGLLDGTSLPSLVSGEQPAVTNLTNAAFGTDGLLSATTTLVNGGLLEAITKPVLRDGSLLDMAQEGLPGEPTNILAADPETELAPGTDAASDDGFLDTLLSGSALTPALQAAASPLDVLGISSDLLFEGLLSEDDVFGMNPGGDAEAAELVGDLLAGLGLTGALAGHAVMGSADVMHANLEDANLEDDGIDSLLNEIIDSGDRATGGLADPLTAILDLDGSDIGHRGLFDTEPAVESALATLFGNDAAGTEASGSFVGGLLGGLIPAAEDEAD